jgi:hypothetical protein
MLSLMNIYGDAKQRENMQDKTLHQRTESTRATPCWDLCRPIPSKNETGGHMSCKKGIYAAEAVVGHGSHGIDEQLPFHLHTYRLIDTVWQDPQIIPVHGDLC